MSLSQTDEWSAETTKWTKRGFLCQCLRNKTFTFREESAIRTVPIYMYMYVHWRLPIKKFGYKLTKICGTMCMVRYIRSQLYSYECVRACTYAHLYIQCSYLATEISTVIILEIRQTTFGKLNFLVEIF